MQVAKWGVNTQLVATQTKKENLKKPISSIVTNHTQKKRERERERERVTSW